jgi:hypothetical protein
MRTHREDMSRIVASTIVLHDLEHICLTYDRVLPKRSEMKSDCYPCICIQTVIVFSDHHTKNQAR